MEQGLLQLLDDFHSGKLQAFGECFMCHDYVNCADMLNLVKSLSIYIQCICKTTGHNALPMNM